MPLSAGVHSSVYGETFYVNVNQFTSREGKCGGCSLEFRKCIRGKAWKTVKTTVLLCLVHAVTCIVMVSWVLGSLMYYNAALPPYNAHTTGCIIVFKHNVWQIASTCDNFMHIIQTRELPRPLPACRCQLCVCPYCHDVSHMSLPPPLIVLLCVQR